LPNRMGSNKMCPFCHTFTDTYRVPRKEGEAKSLKHWSCGRCKRGWFEHGGKPFTLHYIKDEHKELILDGARKSYVDVKSLKDAQTRRIAGATQRP